MKTAKILGLFSFQNHESTLFSATRNKNDSPVPEFPFFVESMLVIKHPNNTFLFVRITIKISVLPSSHHLSRLDDGGGDVVAEGGDAPQHCKVIHSQEVSFRNQLLEILHRVSLNRVHLEIIRGLENLKSNLIMKL